MGTEWLRDGYMFASLDNGLDDAKDAIAEARKYLRAKHKGLSNCQWDCLEWIAAGKDVFIHELGQSGMYWMPRTLYTLANKGYIEYADDRDDYYITPAGLAILEDGR